jgi:hypothetical protein
LFDFRAGLAPLDAGLYEAALASPYLKLKGKWRVALVTSVVAPNYNVLMVEGTSDFLNGLGQVAKPFLDYDEAIEWLVGG